MLIEKDKKVKNKLLFKYIVNKIHIYNKNWGIYDRFYIKFSEKINFIIKIINPISR